MTYAIVDTENSDVLATYSSRAEAERHLIAYVDAHPDHNHEVGIRPYADGRPAGPFESAAQLLGARLAQQHLV
jgi:hypothetical protein